MLGSLEVTSPSFKSFTSFATLSGLPLAFQFPPQLRTCDENCYIERTLGLTSLLGFVK